MKGYVQTFASKGMVGGVQTNAEILVAPGKPVDVWFRALNEAIVEKTRAAAPDGTSSPAAVRAGRTYRPHDTGVTLKKSIRSASKVRSVRSSPTGFRVYGLVGSTALYSLFVDQGTSGGYPIKVLPPKTWGGTDLYEAKAPWSSHTQIIHPGQKGQHFFDKGLDAAYKKVGLSRTSVLAGYKIGTTLSRVPVDLDIPGGTPNDAAFQGRLREWRRWRNEGWKSVGLRRAQAARTRNEAVQAQQAAAERAARKQRQVEHFEAVRRRDAERVAQDAAKAKRLREAREKRDAAKAKKEADYLREMNSRIALRAAFTEAAAYFNEVRKAYPNARIHKVQRGPAILFRVQYTLSDGEVVTHYFGKSG